MQSAAHVRKPAEDAAQRAAEETTQNAAEDLVQAAGSGCGAEASGTSKHAAKQPDQIPVALAATVNEKLPSLFAQISSQMKSLEQDVLPSNAQLTGKQSLLHEQPGARFTVPAPKPACLPQKLQQLPPFGQQN